MIPPRSSAAALVLALCSLCAQADEKQQRLQSDLFQACSQGSLEQVQKLLSEGASASLLAEDYGRLPLHEAIQHAHYEVVRLLVRHGAPLNNPSALARAAGGIAGGGVLPYSEFHTKKMVELLLSLGADVHAADDEPVAAAAGTALTVVQQLVQAGGRPTRKALVNAVTSCQLDNCRIPGPGRR
jgi:ankyrin repeat protein